ncbi:helix-turn-helix domain-containing protein [Ruminococcaceae bacterium OttesenSCG-928-L11]|nr:helix-turn-helix domain-containing protein [Ruminococcaceae bacterium OttesenSCG-928-L11]
MNNPHNAFGIAVRTERVKRNLTQVQLAEKLGMSKRTVIQAERSQSNPKFETVILLAQELEISLDAIVFPETASPNNVPKCVHEFFKDKSEQEAQKFIDLCRGAESLKESK